MRNSGRRLGRRPCFGIALGLVAAALLCWPLLGPVSAREVTVRGSQQKGFGRIELRFDETAKVRVRASNGVLVVAFDAPVRVAGERLVQEIAPYVSAVRRDPDGTGFRAALVAPVRTSLLEAGERVFIDLLPPGWSGLPPALPPDVVAELAERARVAEAKLRQESAGRQASRPSVTLRLAELPTLTRLVFEPPPGTRVDWTSGEDATVIVFGGLLSLDLAGARPKGASGVAEFSSSQQPDSLTVRLSPSEGYRAHAFREAEALVLDLANPSKAGPPAKARSSALQPGVGTEASPGGLAEEAVTGSIRPEPSRAAVASGPTREPPTPARAASPAPSGATGATAPEPGDMPASGGVAPIAAAIARGGSILFPFAGPTAAAAFERGGRLTVVFDTTERLDRAALAAAFAGLAQLEEVKQDGGYVLLRLEPTEGRRVRLALEETAWRLILGGPPGLPADDAKVSRSVDAEGNAEVAVGLSSTGAVHWVAGEDGSRLAVVTVAGQRQALATPRNYVEFALLPSLQGALIEARADDVTVALGRRGVLISRGSGLSLSTVTPPNESTGAAPLVITRESWMQDSAGSAAARYRELVAAAADAPRSGRGEARYRLARFLLANGLSHEAASVLALARSEDAVFAKRRETVLLSAIASVRAGRPEEARSLLGQGSLADDPEAILWRAVLDMRDREWTRALAGFRRSADTLGLYPEDLSGALRLLGLRAALESGEVRAAEAIMAAIDRLPMDSVPRDEHDLARARVDEVASRNEAALKAYGQLAEEAARPVAAEAVVRGTALAVRMNRLSEPDATRRLELLSIAWRGDDVELATLVELARLYAAQGRWRDMFATAQRANHAFPKHDSTRKLHDDTARSFESLILGETSAKLSPVDILALYYDFKEFAPIGRRGDEIVRRLSDRLVDLDLLDQAASLLQHQVDKRLTGAARAAVAARLAAIRLMSGKPAQALTALQATRLAELPADIRRFRLLLEAQADADLTRTDLALEIIEGEDGPDFTRLRAAILFAARRWREAGDASEALVGTRWEKQDRLTDRERSDVIRAAVAHVLAEEPLALERLRSKFAAKMADSPDAKTFDLLMQPGAARSREFRAAMREAGRADGLRRLLADWASKSLPADDPEGSEATSAAKRDARPG